MDIVFLERLGQGLDVRVVDGEDRHSKISLDRWVGLRSQQRVKLVWASEPYLSGDDLDAVLPGGLDGFHEGLTDVPSTPSNRYDHHCVGRVPIEQREGLKIREWKCFDSDWEQ